jgi:SAM-dependent methyltransferase
MQSPTQRFSSRVEKYVQYRPRYPQAVIETLRAECGLTPDSVVADIGSGTGFLAELFLRHGNRVHGVEPNREMRQAGERLLAGYPNFTSMEGTAEATGLPDASVDFVTAGQAFHWFDRPRARAEFSRILRPGGWVALAWNNWDTGGSAFMAGYEALVRAHGTDYAEVNHRLVDRPALEEFFGGPVKLRAFPHRQEFDLEGLRGRLLSSSYVPEADQPGYAAMLAALDDLFAAHQSGGQVAFEYIAELYYARLGSKSANSG